MDPTIHKITCVNQATAPRATQVMFCVPSGLTYATAYEHTPAEDHPKPKYLVQLGRQHETMESNGKRSMSSLPTVEQSASGVQPFVS